MAVWTSAKSLHLGLTVELCLVRECVNIIDGRMVSASTQKRSHPVSNIWHTQKHQSSPHRPLVAPSTQLLSEIEKIGGQESACWLGESARSCSVASVESGSEAGNFSRLGSVQNSEKKRNFSLRALIRQDDAKLMSPACLAHRRHQKMCPTDRESVQYSL